MNYLQECNIRFFSKLSVCDSRVCSLGLHARCQKSLNFTYALKCYQQKCKWLHFSWATLYWCLIFSLQNCFLCYVFLRIFTESQHSCAMPSAIMLGIPKPTVWLSRCAASAIVSKWLNMLQNFFSQSEIAPLFYFQKYTKRQEISTWWLPSYVTPLQGRWIQVGYKTIRDY